MLKHAQARNMALSLWHTGHAAFSNRPVRYPPGEVKYHKTSRKGVFWFSGRAGEGFIIDARGLAEHEKELLSRFVTPEVATEYSEADTGKVRVLLNPFSKKARTAKVRMAWEVETFPVFALEKSKTSCLVFALTDITVKGIEAGNAEEELVETFSLSAHDLMELEALRVRLHHNRPEKPV